MLAWSLFNDKQKEERRKDQQGGIAMIKLKLRVNLTKQEGGCRKKRQKKNSLTMSAVIRRALLIKARYHRGTMRKPILLFQTPPPTHPQTQK